MKKLYWNSMKKSLALTMIACLSVGMTACSSKKENSKNASTDGNKVTEQGNNNGGAAESTPAGDSTATATDATYTYNEAHAGSPKRWNPHEWETNDDSYIYNYTTSGLYGFQFNEARDGYVLCNEMAAAEPVDVTKEYAGNETYGVPADATEMYAFKIALREDCCWEDGTPINADTYIYSMQQLLDPHMVNFRASGYTAGTFEIANANKYNHSGMPIYTEIFQDGNYRDVEDKDMYFSLTKAIPFFGDTAETYYNSTPDNFKDKDGKDIFKKYADQGDYIQLTDEAKADILAISAAFGDDNPEAYKEWCFTYDGVSEEVSFDTVGIIKTGDYEITFVLATPITNFYLYYNLASGFLVNKDLYEANKKETGDIVKTSYGTAVDNYISYGPYKLADYQVDKEIKLVKNDKWYGYSDGNHEGQYQTDNIVCQIIEAQATQLQLFLQGGLDKVDLVADDMDAYRSSDYIVYTPETYTSKLTFNGDKKALKKRESKGINKSILSYHDFRKALALSVDRTEFAAQCTATHKAGYGILNYLYCSNPDTGEIYRNTEEAKKVLCDFYGVSSEDQITGYNKEEAAKLMTKAYEEAKKAGDINDTDTVELEYLVYTNDDIYVKTVKFIEDAFLAAAVGTPLEGRIKVKMTADADYYDHAQQGNFEIITSTWGGSSMDPYGIMECYADESKMFEYGFKPKKTELTIDINGESITKNFYEWYEALCTKEYATAEPAIRNTILAAMEGKLLEECYCTPLYYRTTASLVSKKVTLGSENYVQILEFGDIQYMTYNYTDEEWKAYCEENNNQLEY